MPVRASPARSTLGLVVLCRGGASALSAGCLKTLGGCHAPRLRGAARCRRSVLPQRGTGWWRLALGGRAPLSTAFPAPRAVALWGCGPEPGELP